MSKKEEPNEVKPEQYNPRQIMDIANAFLKAAKKCNDAPSIESSGWVHPLLVPIVVNVSLACELF